MEFCNNAFCLNQTNNKACIMEYKVISNIDLIKHAEEKKTKTTENRNRTTQNKYTEKASQNKLCTTDL